MTRKALCPISGLIAAILRFALAGRLSCSRVMCGAGGGWGRRSWSRANTFAASSSHHFRFEPFPTARVITTCFPWEGYLVVGIDGGVRHLCRRPHRGITTAARGLGAPMTLPAPGFRGSCG